MNESKVGTLKILGYSEDKLPVFDGLSISLVFSFYPEGAQIDSSSVTADKRIMKAQISSDLQDEWEKQMDQSQKNTAYWTKILLSLAIGYLKYEITIGNIKPTYSNVWLMKDYLQAIPDPTELHGSDGLTIKF